jgi:hypothetical protein
MKQLSMRMEHAREERGVDSSFRYSRLIQHRVCLDAGRDSPVLYQELGATVKFSQLPELEERGAVGCTTHLK